MYELPLFPLHTVLFPGAPLHLHIFEERYKRMMRLCLETHEPFGVVLIRKGAEALGPLAEPYAIGCTALVRQVQRLDEGRLNILAVGQDRFRTLILDNSVQPYWVATVEPYPLQISDLPAVETGGAQLRQWVERYRRILVEAGIAQIGSSGLPDDTLELAYLSASILHLPSDQKQALLALDSAEDLVSQLVSIYRREVALIQGILEKGVEERGAFSLN